MTESLAEGVLPPWHERGPGTAKPADDDAARPHLQALVQRKLSSTPKVHAMHQIATIYVKTKERSLS